jgi:hypothetical protein
LNITTLFDPEWCEKWSAPQAQGPESKSLEGSGQHHPGSVANLVISLEPAFTTVIAFLVLAERLGMSQVAGGLMILGGVGVLRVSEAWRPAGQGG